MSATYNWRFRYGASLTTFTTDVISWSGFIGRHNYQDNYAGNRFSITIKNQNNQAANFTRGTQIVIELDTGSNFVGGQVNRIEYNDYPGNTGFSTATIIVDDGLARAGRFYMQNVSYYSANDITSNQAIATNGVASATTAPYVVAKGTGSSVAAGTPNYSGTMLNRLNQLQQTERGQLWSYWDAVNFDGVKFYSRSQMSQQGVVEFARSTPQQYTIAYSDFRRIQAGDNFMNYVTVSGDGVAGNQTATNSTSITSYGRAGYQVSTLDPSTTQAFDNASWLANSQSDPAKQRFEIDFDTATNNTSTYAAIYFFLIDLVFYNRTTFKVNYRIPGAASDTSTYVVVEGLQITGTPTSSKFTLYASPSEYYQYFTLNSNVFGILNTSRLGW